MRKYGWGLALLLVVAVSGWSVSAQQASGSPTLGAVEHDALVRMLSAGASRAITFSDEQGRPISEAQFLVGLKRTRTFSHKRDEVHHSTTFALLAAKASSRVDLAQGQSLEQALHVHYKVKPGQALPAFQLADVQGTTVNNAGLHGTPTVLNFFFADCIACIAETPALNAYAKAHPQVRVLAVTYDDARTAKQYISQRHFAWPVVYGAQHLIDALGVTAYPTIALIGADGRLLDIRLSASIQSGGDTITAKDMGRWVTRTLASKGEGPARVLTVKDSRQPDEASAQHLIDLGGQHLQ